MNENDNINKTPETNVIYGYKGFDKNMKCLGYQFKEGHTYFHEGLVQIYSSGFHFCENPIDIFEHYSPRKSIFHTVEGCGDGSDGKLKANTWYYLDIQGNFVESVIVRY